MRLHGVKGLGMKQVERQVRKKVARVCWVKLGYVSGDMSINSRGQVPLTGGVTECVSITGERRFVLTVVANLYANTANRSTLAGSARARAFARTSGRKANAKIVEVLGYVGTTRISPGARFAT